MSSNKKKAVSASRTARHYAEKGQRTAEAQGRLQRKAESIQAATPKGRSGASGKRDSVQPPGRQYPTPPMRKQRLTKPGAEALVEPRPQYQAPHYRGSGKLANMIALITGGDSGIGRAVAVLFAREGADVSIIYLNEHDDAEETKQAVEKEGRRAILIPGDVGDPAFCRHAVKQTLTAFGKIDLLVNNAAFQQHVSSLEDLSEEQWGHTFRINIFGYFYMAKAAVPHLRPGSAILNSGSVTGIQGSKQLLDYASTKGAIHAFTKSLAQQLLERGIRVNAVAPGPVWTPLNPADGPPGKLAKFGENVPMRRPAQPEEIAPAFVFLASPADSSYITGEVLPILGGETVGSG